MVSAVMIGGGQACVLGQLEGPLDRQSGTVLPCLWKGKVKAWKTIQFLYPKESLRTAPGGSTGWGSAGRHEQA